MDKKRGQFLASLILSVITAASMTACDEDRGSGGGSNASEPKPTELLSKELKKFQLIRRERTSLQASPERAVKYENPFTSNVGAFYLSDELSVQQIPSNLKLKLKGTVSCKSGVTNQNYKQNLDISMAKPVPFSRIFPREVLFQPKNKSLDSVECTFHDLWVEDQFGRQMFARKSETNTPSRISTHIGAMNFALKLYSEDIVWHDGNEPELTEEDIKKHLQIVSNSQQVYDLQFDELEIECETFRLRRKVQQDSLAFFKSFEIREGMMKDGYQTLFPQYFSNQQCRVFAYQQSQLLGFSHYFRLVASEIKPVVDVKYVGKDHYGTGHGNQPRYHNTEYAQLVLANPYEYPIAMKIDLDAIKSRAQFLSYKRRLQNSTVQNSMMRSHIKTLKPLVRVDYEFSDQESAVFRPDELEHHSFHLMPGDRAWVRLFFHAGSCDLWTAMRRASSLKREDLGMLGTYGVLVDAKVPAIGMMSIQPGGNTVITQKQFRGLQHTTKIPASRPRNGRYRFVYSTNDNRSGWREKIKWPKDDLVIRNPRPTVERSAEPVCTDDTFFR